MRRDSKDQAWKSVKAQVAERDKVCRLSRILTVQEFIALRQRAGSYLSQLDAAHYRAVSEMPELVYDPNNIVLLNHYSHSLLDDYKDPITGKPIDEETHNKWWERILKGNPEQYNYLLEKDLLRGENE